jgi:hypothetical protein
VYLLQPRFKKTGGKIGDKKNLKSSGGKTRDKFKTLQSAQASERLAKLEKVNTFVFQLSLALSRIIRNQ